MTDDAKIVTTQDLELYHDGELGTEQHSKIGDALLHDPKLRERFATIRRVDDALHSAFLDERVAGRRERHVARHFAVYPAMAACLLLAVGLVWWLMPGPGSVPRYGIAQRPTESKSTAENDYRSIRVVLSLPIKKTLEDPDPDLEDRTKSAPETAAADDVEGFLARFDRSLGLGRIEGTLLLLDEAENGERIEAYRRLGDVLRSADVAEKILDRLSPREQLAVCRLWARETAVQPTVFGRLRRLSEDPGLYDEMRLTLAALAEDPRLRTWLRGYQIVPVPPSALDGAS